MMFTLQFNGDGQLEVFVAKPNESWVYVGELSRTREVEITLDFLIAAGNAVLGGGYGVHS